MNLNAIAGPIVSAVNPASTLTIQQSTGYATDSSGMRSPIYSTLQVPGCNVQALDGGDLRLLESLNIQGESRKVYVNGQFNSVIRAAQKGGDLVTDGCGETWLITHVPEYWAGWVCFFMTRQALS